MISFAWPTLLINNASISLEWPTLVIKHHAGHPFSDLDDSMILLHGGLNRCFWFPGTSPTKLDESQRIDSIAAIHLA